MTELFTLLGKVVVDTQEANESLDDTVDKAEKSEGKLSSIGEKIGNGLQKLAKAGAVVLAATATVAATALVSLSTKAVQCYADYEQLVGGVETLFGAGGQTIEEYADSVGKTVDEVRTEYDALINAQTEVFDNAARAYETAGMSANEYMETVTGFSAALISSLGGDTEKAAEYADRAIVDMADNANKMGTHMELIQNAYQGFAKQNYTMLDNLKLGYGGTQSEMQRLIADAAKMTEVQEQLGITVDASSMSYDNIVNAIHVMQTEMGIAGATQAEAASTIQGSIGMLKASWTNFVTGLADENADLSTLMDAVIDSFTTVVDNIAPKVIEVLPKIVGAVEYIIGGIAGYLPDMISELLPSLMSAVTTLVSQMITLIPSLLSSLAPVLVDTLGSIFEQISSSTGLDFSGLFNGIVEGASQMGVALKGILPSIVSVIQQLIPPLLQIIQAILPAVTALLEPIIMIIQSLYTVLSPIISILGLVISQIASMLIPVIEKLCDFITTVLTPIIQGILVVVEEVIGLVVTFVQENMTTIQSIFQSAFDVISGIIQFFAALFTGDWQGMWDAVKSILQSGYDFVSNIFNLLFSVISSIVSYLFDVVKSAFENIKNAILDKISAALNFVIEKFNSLPEPIKNVLSVVLGFIVLCVQSIIEKIKTTYENVVSIFNTIKDFITTVMNAIWSAISNKLETIKVTFSTKLSSVVDGVKEKFQAILDGIKEKMELAKNAVSEAIEKIKGFFDFEWKLPDLKLPHIKIDGEWDLKEGTFPSFGVEWYKKGAVMKQPTVFGMNPTTGKLMAGGEAGAEAVAPIDVLQGYVAQAVASQNAGLVEILEKILIAILSLNGDMKDSFIEALERTKFTVNNREFARLVKAVN